MIDILKSIPFFGKLNDEDIQKIAEKVQMEYFPEGHTIFNEGDDGGKMYIIKRGQVKVVRNKEVLAVLKDNAFFGEMALVSDELRNATIETASEVELLTLDKFNFKELLETNSAIAEMVSYEVVKRANAIF